MIIASFGIFRSAIIGIPIWQFVYVSKSSHPKPAELYRLTKNGDAQGPESPFTDNKMTLWV